MYQRPKARVSKIESVAAPVMGLNTADPIANMAPEFAVTLLNFFPSNFSLRVREGYSEWATGLGAGESVRTIVNYVKNNGTEELFAATNAGLYDITSKGAVTDPAVVDLTSGFLSYTQFANVAGNWLIMCNGVDSPVLYDGTTFTDMTETTSPTLPGDISGVDPKKFKYVHAHQRRLWFVEEDSMTAWYLDLDAISGVAKPFYLGSVFQKGGFLRSIFSWSADSGEGLDDILVFASSEGELAGYVGYDPDDAINWALSAVHFTSPPLTDRMWVEAGGDSLILTSYGVLPLSKIIASSGQVLTYVQSISRNISTSILQEVKSRGESIGWELVVHPSRQALILILPPGTKPAAQFVMNLETGAWTQYDLPAVTATVSNGELYFGTDDGRVMKFGNGYFDEVSLDGSTYKFIEARMAQAYNYFGTRGRNKHYNLVRPLWISADNPNYIVGISADYTPTSDFFALPLPPPETGGGSLWGTAIWGTSLWSESPNVRSSWDGLGALGYCASLLVKVNISQYTELVSSDWVYEEGMSL